MISTEIPSTVSVTQRPVQGHRKNLRNFTLHRATVICLFLACLGTSWFAYQNYLVPQEASFTPDWQGARWIQASDGTSSASYFRYATSIESLPDTAFVTISASQVFRLSINGYVVGTSFRDFQQGYFPRTYMYDISSVLQSGTNVFAVVVSNFDKQRPALRMSVGVVQGRSIRYSGTGINSTPWQATIQSNLVYSHYATPLLNSSAWSTNTFDASSWQLATSASYTPPSSMLTMNPLIYERPLSNYWMSAGYAHDAYFVRHFSLPANVTNAWLRMSVVGTADVFINGHASIVWNGAPISKPQDITQYLSDNITPAQYQSGLVLGVYNIASSLQAGDNTIAVHVTAPASGSARIGLESLNAAVSLDALIIDGQNHQYWLTSTNGWHASSVDAEGWVQGNAATRAWGSPVAVGRPGVAKTFYVQSGNSSRNVQLFPYTRLAIIIIGSVLVVLGLWLFMALVVLKGSYASRWNALETLSLAYLPALSCEALLIVLGNEATIPQPFPYRTEWGLVLIALVLIGYALLGWNAYIRQKQLQGGNSVMHVSSTFYSWLHKYAFSAHNTTQANKAKTRSYESTILAWMRIHWGLVVIVAIAFPLIVYNISYEPYWQDELVSFYAAKGILAHGIPVLPSGFIYPKGELYSYMLALTMAIFGDQGGAPRLPSIAEYLISLPLFYIVGTYFFNRRVALLATAILAFSPTALLWGRQVRMYEQAQLFALLAFFLIHKALNERHNVRLIYLAVASIVLMYLSHEETFILFPAIVSWVVFMSRDEKHRAFAVFYQKHWWIAGSLGAAIIGVQLLIVHFTHPAVLGTDQSQIPLVQFTTNNLPYYLKLLFIPWTLRSSTPVPYMTINSILAVIGCFIAFRSTDLKAKYCAWFMFTSFLTLILAFTLSSDRYLYPVLPIYYLVGAYAALQVLRNLWTFTRSRIAISQQAGKANVRFGGGYISNAMSITTSIIIVLLLACVLILPMLPINNYNILVSRVAGLSYHRHYPDYDGVGQYMKQNWRKGDVVIDIIPAISAYYYIGHSDYFFSANRALYLFEQDGQITDTPTGSRPIINQADLTAILAKYPRVWILSDNGSYQSEERARFTFPQEFHMVYQGYQSSVYLRGN